MALWHLSHRGNCESGDRGRQFRHQHTEGPQTEAFVLRSVCVFKYLMLPLLLNYVLKTLLSKTEIRLRVTEFQTWLGMDQGCASGGRCCYLGSKRLSRKMNQEAC